MIKVSGHNNERYSGKSCRDFAWDRVGRRGGGSVCDIIYLSVCQFYDGMDLTFNNSSFDNVDVTLQWEWIVSSFVEEEFQSS